MPEETTSADVQGTDASEADQKSYDQTYVEKLRGEAGGYRRKLRETETTVEDLNAKLKELEDRDKSELVKATEEKERLANALAAREREYAELTVKAAISSEAVGMGIIDPDAAFVLIDKSSLEVANGEIKGVKKALERLIKEKPYLIEQSSSSALPVPGAGGQTIDSKEKGLDSAILEMLTGSRKPNRI